MENIKKEEQQIEQQTEQIVEQTTNQYILNGTNMITIPVVEYKKLIIDSTKQQSYNQITPQSANNYVIVEENKPIEKKKENGDIF